MFPVAWTKGTGTSLAFSVCSSGVPTSASYARTFQSGPSNPVPVGCCTLARDRECGPRPLTSWPLISDINFSAAYSPGSSAPAGL
jgi:hypothetical protein